MAIFDRSVTMKRPSRTLFSLVLLIMIVFTLSYRAVIRRSFSYLQLDNHVSPVSNSTLLQFAAIDVNEASDKIVIEQLLEENFNTSMRYRSFSSWLHSKYIRTRSSATSLSVQLQSPMSYRIWLDFQKSLGDWSQNKLFQPDIMLDLIDLVKHPLDRHYGLPADSGKYPSCAVVGNSGILLKTEYGELIDSHDIVIRLNNAWIKGFERNVGSKTNISFVNSNILHRCASGDRCFCHPYGEKVPMVMYICQAVHFIDYTICNSSHKAPLLVTDPRFDILCARIVKYYSAKRFVEETGKSLDEWAIAHDAPQFHYSSGLQAIMVALGTCAKVSIFGFGKSPQAAHHYHTKQKAELHLHDYEAEYDFYHDLVRNPQVIPFLSGNFKVPPVVIYK